MKIHLTLIILCFSIFSTEIDFLSSLKKEFKSIDEKLLEADVLVIGEEHDDKRGHKLKLELIKYLSKNHNLSISMEMFETDQQVLLNEYLNSSIDEKTFLAETRLWENFKDYQPILDFAKENKISVIASNSPKRFARILSRKGIKELENLPLESKKFIPSIYLIEAFKDLNYEKKILESIQAHGKISEQGLKQMIMAQNLWDATMAERIFNSKLNNKIIHINGRFHSDNRMGVVYRLEKMGLKVITISILQNEKDLNSNLADFVICSTKIQVQE